MGTSTVSGPFRSENGFQELVDGVWTPVGGGGGGGGAEVLILPRVATNTYFTIATTVPEVGKQWKLILAPYFYAPQGGTLQALFAIPAWGGDYTFYGAAATIWATNSSIHGMNFSPSSGNITSLYFDNGNYYQIKS